MLPERVILCYHFRYNFWQHEHTRFISIYLGKLHLHR
jgi:hypothetical protein